MAEPRSTAQEAADPSTSPERLLALAEKHPQLHRLLVLNPSTPEVARQWILATNPWARRAYDQQHAGAAASADPGPETASAPHQQAGRDPERTGPPGTGSRRPRAAAPAWADLPAESVWGDLRSPSEDSVPAGADDATVEHTPVPAADDRTPSVVPPPAPPLPSPVEAYPWSAVPSSTGVRIASPDGVVPLGPAATPAAPHTEAAPFQFPPSGPSAQPGESARLGDGDRSRRRLWLAGAGCLLLALLLILASVFIGRALLADDEPAEQPTTTAVATEDPSPEPTEQEPTPAPEAVSPAPADAQEMTALSSPTGNITCVLEEDSAACSVMDRDFSEAGLEDCEDGPFSIAVADGEAAPACGSSFLSDSAATLEYDNSAVQGDMACTSRSDGMTCWNTMTGKGFAVNRAGYETF
ncbi:hypothetical protein [Brachybacterium sp. UNK5269]|uniref:variant leucine-rich repeat-containing protein n=1 Tax=Brachybacterium sp. UNK5269 TaxID=3408576 RepID=UPI003BB0F753